MAETKEKVEKPKNKANSNIIKNLFDFRQASSTILTGTSEKFLSGNKTDMELVRHSINRIASNLRHETGGDITDFFSALYMNVDKKESSALSGPNGKKGFLNINKLVEESEQRGVNSLLTAEAGRIATYYDYRRIYHLIPQMAQSLDTYVDNIISPDDFTKNSVTIEFEGKGLNTNDSERIEKSLKILTDKYKINKRIPKILKNALQDGDYFLAVLSLQKEFTKLLNEGASDEVIAKETDKVVTISDNYFPAIINEDVIAVKERIEERVTDKKERAEALVALNEEQKVLKEYAKMAVDAMNDNIIISRSSAALLKESTEMKNEFNVFVDKDEVTKKTDDGIGIDVKGSIVKTLKPEKIVKLEDDTGICYGYVYFEDIVDTPTGDNVTIGNGLGPVQQDRMRDVLSSQDGSTDAFLYKKKYIYKTFVQGIAKKLDKNILNKNKEFADIIYSLLKQDYIIKKQMRITYLSPKEVVHFGNDDSDGTYFDSLFRKILFSAKLYIAVLTSTLMHRLVRAPSKRLFYIETGLDNDDGGAVNSFIRDIKSKELKFDDISGGGINNILANIGTFNDIFVPVVDGAKPIEIETIEENAPQVDDEFTEWLMKALTSGVGIPHAFIADSENVQFARSLTMENAKFLRTVIRIQQTFGEQASELVQKLWENEYDEETKEKEPKTGSSKDTTSIKESEKKPTEKISDSDFVASINASDIIVKFPSPAALNTTNLSEQISNTQTVIDYITEITIGTDDEKKTLAFKHEMAKKLLTNIPWEMVEEILKKMDVDASKEGLSKGKEEETDY